MKGKRHYVGVLSLFFILSFMGVNGLFITSAHAEEAEIIFIANTSVNETALTQRELQQIFLGRKSRWEDRERIYFVLFDDDVAYPLFLDAIGRTHSQFSQHWRREVFTGKGREPSRIDSLEDLIEYVANTEGAISYVLEPVANENIKIISITE